MAIPLHLQIMRNITETKEVPGSGNNPVIMEWPRVIAQQFPDMRDYCDDYTADEIAWCGLVMGYVMAATGIRPVFGPADTDKFLWARAWAKFGEKVERSDTPELGDVLVLSRHVTLFDGFDGSYYRGRGGNQADQVKVLNYSKAVILDIRRPPKPTVAPVSSILTVEHRPILEVGSEGPDVVIVQTCLKVKPIDGDFGPITEAAVKAFQDQQHLEVNGIVGPKTWEALEREFHLPAIGRPALPPLKPFDPSAPPKPISISSMPSPFKPEEIEKIISIAQGSSIASYDWRGRGKAPAGYTNGMAVAFAHVCRRFNAGNSSALEMAKADTGNTEKDALSWYAVAFERLGMDNSKAGIDTLRHLFTLQLGLGMRESSGEHCCGRDQSASNTNAMTCEAGLFQASWNIKSYSPEMQKLMDDYDTYPEQCHLNIFSKGVECSSGNWKCYGSGDGYEFQEMAKKCPQFAVEIAAVGLRNLRKHWGPINRHEVELRPEADEMFLKVQEYVRRIDKS